MADLITIKGGNGNPPTLQDRELAYSKDQKALYIGTDNGNVRLCGADDIPRLEALIDDITAQIEDITARLEKLEPIE